MITELLNDPRVAVAKTEPRYPSRPPYDPSERFPEYSGSISREDNPVYRAAREAMRNLGLDAENFGTCRWNPLGEVVRPGNTVLIKPNWVCHKNLGEEAYGLTDRDSLITHGSVLRAVLDYVCLALQGTGKIIIGDSPIQNADWGALIELGGVSEILQSVRQRFPGIHIELCDFRLEKAVVRKTLGRERIVAKSRHEPIPEKFYEIDLEEKSLLIPLMRDGKYAFGVANYPRSRMIRAHNLQRNLYLIPRVVLETDVLINVPKVKTHVKAGITCALKNLVGINAMKDYLPHFRFGSPKQGGDEYPDGNWLWDLKWWLAHKEWEKDVGFFKLMLWLMERAAGLGLRLLYRYPREYGNVGGGGWYGNDTLWRTILDINRALLYYDQTNGMIRSNPLRSIRYFVIADGIVAGHKEGPLSPTPLKTGWVLAGKNPVAVDTVVSALLGFDFRRISQVAEAYKVKELPLAMFDPDTIKVLGLPGVSGLNDIYIKEAFVRAEPSLGWKGYIEYRDEKKEGL